MAGRPTDYTPDKARLANDYFFAVKHSGGIPYLEELALDFDVDEDTITNWGKVHPEFFGAIKKIKTLQKFRLLHKTMSKESTTGAIFQLKCNHGMIDKQVYEHRNEPGQTFGVSINAGGGFVPATVQLSTPSARSDAGRQSSVQSFSVAPSSPKDNDGDK